MDRIIREILLYSEEVEEILEYVRLETFRALLFTEQQYLNIRIAYGCATTLASLQEVLDFQRLLVT